MLQALLARLEQGYRTVPYPAGAPVLPPRFRGRPTFDASACRNGCRACVDACPTDAIVPGTAMKLDLGRCLFCDACVEACPEQVIQFSNDHRLTTRSREALLTDGKTLALAQALEAKMLKLYGRSLKLRQVSAAGCNACEADVNVLNTVVFDLSRFGIQFVASPRHADGLLITGPVSQNMKLGLEKTYAALPPPKLVIAVGACAISGGPFAGHAEVCNGASGIVPVDLFVPGCPPHPFTILDGLLRLIDRLPKNA